jgi:hypothetical protein
MKKIIALLATCLTIGAAHAAILATMPNNSGGRIELTDVPVPASVQRQMSNCRNTYIAKSWADGTNDIYGCYRFIDDTVVIEWPGTERTYSVHAFTRTAAGDALVNSQ